MKNENNNNSPNYFSEKFHDKILSTKKHDAIFLRYMIPSLRNMYKYVLYIFRNKCIYFIYIFKWYCQNSLVA